MAGFKPGDHPRYASSDIGSGSPMRELFAPALADSPPRIAPTLDATLQRTERATCARTLRARRTSPRSDNESDSVTPLDGRNFFLLLCLSLQLLFLSLHRLLPHECLAADCSKGCTERRRKRLLLFLIAAAPD
eukprot:3116236-Prymnesium_polylepis.2